MYGEVLLLLVVVPVCAARGSVEKRARRDSEWMAQAAVPTGTGSLATSTRVGGHCVVVLNHVLSQGTGRGCIMTT